MPNSRPGGSAPPSAAATGGPRDRVRCGLLLDFYGELLSPRQRECCELAYNDDLSLTEIAEACGISRQGAWDNLRRGTAALEDIEARTGLLRRHTETVARLKRLQATLLCLEEGCGADGAQRALARTALDELGAILEGVGASMKMED